MKKALIITVLVLSSTAVLAVKENFVIKFLDGVSGGGASKVVEKLEDVSEKAGSKVGEVIDNHAAASQEIIREKQRKATEAAQQAGHRDRKTRLDVRKFKFDKLKKKLKGDATGGGML